MVDVIINGPEGRLEGRYHHQEEKGAPAALVLRPHPKHGGTMNNKVTYHLYHTLVEAGFSVLRFNFRGVGRSQGVFDNGIGELADAATALDWLQAQNQDASTFWVGGFSFGSWIALQLLMRRPELETFLAVSPPANLYDFTFLTPCPAPGLMVQGTADSIVSEASVATLHQRLSNQKAVRVSYQTIDQADHFFQQHMDALTQVLREYIEEYVEGFMRRQRVRPDRRKRQLPNS